MQGLWRMSGLEHHKTDRLCDSLVKQTQTVVEQTSTGFSLNALCFLPHALDHHNAPHLASVQLDEYQQQIIVSQGFIQAIHGHRIKSETL